MLAEPKLFLDHIAVAARTLAEGVAYVERQLGVSVPPGGEHRQMGTHNHLLRLDDDLFLEVIATNPNAPMTRKRWFALDDPQMQAGLRPARLCSWVVRTEVIDELLPTLPKECGPAVAISRGSFSWKISVPDDGSLPYAGAFPTVIEWSSPGPHPAVNMIDHGCALLRLEVEHPESATIAKTLQPLFKDPRVVLRPGPEVRLLATLLTPRGPRTLA